MSHDPHTRFDQSVLDVIEHSPVGAVPHTPAYQDALDRLRASHQVYGSADHKNGHVTVRSLAAKPAFYPKNLEAFLAGNEDLALENDAGVFTRYVEALPSTLTEKAEACRSRVVARRLLHRGKAGNDMVRDPMHSLFLVPGSGPQPGLPGNYLFGSVLATPAGGWALHVHDAGDGVAMCDIATPAEALQKFQEVLASAPFKLSELASVGFHSN